MVLARFFNSSVDFSISLVQRLVEKPKNAIREAIRNCDQERPFLGPNELPYDALFPAKSFCPDVYEVNLQLRYYLSRSLEPKHAVNLECSCHLLIKNLRKNRHLSLANLSAGIQRFYTAVERAVVCKSTTDPDFSLDEFLEHVESFVCVHGYDILFCAKPGEEVVDLLLQDRIRSLYWITTQDRLDTVLNLDSEVVENLLHDAMVELSHLNGQKRIKDKFECVAKCAAKIAEAVHESTGAMASADEFLPILIHVIIRANPTMIKSNLDFMQRFGLNWRTYRGESGYHFTNLCSAVQYIQQLDDRSL